MQEEHHSTYLNHLVQPESEASVKILKLDDSRLVGYVRLVGRDGKVRRRFLTVIAVSFALVVAVLVVGRVAQRGLCPSWSSLRKLGSAFAVLVASCFLSPCPYPPLRRDRCHHQPAHVPCVQVRWLAQGIPTKSELEDMSSLTKDLLNEGSKRGQKGEGGGRGKAGGGRRRRRG